MFECPEKCHAYDRIPPLLPIDRQIQPASGMCRFGLLYTRCPQKASHFQTEITLEILGLRAQFRCFSNAELYRNLTM